LLRRGRGADSSITARRCDDY